jgi:hypothetical protein
VVGDDASYFSSEVWLGVLEAAKVEHESEVGITSEELEPILDLPYPQALAKLSKFGWGRERRPSTRKPIPLQLSHSHDPSPRWLRNQLRRILDLFDVWAIVASASAGDVKPLREALAGIDIPLLVTTDSTTVSASGQRPNELRLMPSNRSQATAMLFTAIRGNLPNPGSEREDLPLRSRPKIACSQEETPQARQYVQDLVKQLHNEARRHGIMISEFNEMRDHMGPVIVIGYSGHAESIIKRRVPRRITILSDGCATDSVTEAVEQERDDSQFWYVARPEAQLREVGRTSFSAVAEAGKKLLTWDAQSSDQEFPKTSLRDVIKIILAESSDLFTFDGIENVAPAYRVEPVLDDVELGVPEPPRQTLNSKGTKKGHLQALR